jgi:tight adherence protein C
MAPLLLALFAVGCVFLFVFGWHLRSGERMVPDDLVDPPPEIDPPGIGALASVSAMVGGPLTPRVLSRLTPQRLARIRRRIDLAGRPKGMTVESYVRQHIGDAIVFGGMGLVLILTGGMLPGVLVLVLGSVEVDLILFGMSRKRQDEIERTLPDFLDVLAVTVSAGVSFRNALDRVSATMAGALPEEIRVTLRQMELGTSRRAAFEDLRGRNGCPPLSRFVTAILQAEELGAPLTQALAEISMDMRRESAQYARRKAQRTEPRITGITTLFIVPGVLLLMIGVMWYGANLQSGLTDVFG